MLLEGVDRVESEQRRVYEEEQHGEVQGKEEISFYTRSQSYCVSFVSMVDSTETTYSINNQPDKIRRYYYIFINTMAAIARNFDAKIIKNTGTSLVYYFPKTSNLYTLSSFKNVIECGVTMMAADNIINMKLKEEGLPSMHYKISADYGRVEVARSLSSPDTDDLFGSTMNVCAKINSMAPPTGMVIGSHLYYIVKKLSLIENDYCQFKRIGQYSIAPSFKHQYPVYSVTAVEGAEAMAKILDLEEQIPKLQKHSYSEASSRIKRHLKPYPDYKNYPFGNQMLKQEEEKRMEEEKWKQTQQQKKQSHVAPYTIMIVDNEPDILLTYKTCLDSAGYNVDSFTDPREALIRFANAHHGTYNLVIMDIRMPNLNGLQLYYRLKTKNPNIKILFISALDAAQEMVSILPGIGLNDVLRKPIDNDQFLSKVKAVLK